MSFNELLVSPFAYAPPAQVLEGLTDSDAVRRLDRTPHTVAELVMLGRWPPPAGSWTW